MSTVRDSRRSNYLSRDMTTPTKRVCAQRRLRSAWASTQSDQESSLSAWGKLGSLATHWAHSEASDQTGRMSRLIWVSAGRTVTLLVLSRGGSSLNLNPASPFEKWKDGRISVTWEWYFAFENHKTWAQTPAQRPTLCPSSEIITMLEERSHRR